MGQQLTVSLLILAAVASPLRASGDEGSGKFQALAKVAESGSPQEQVSAAARLAEAARQGNAEAQRLYGRCFEEGWGVVRDLEKAVEWSRRASERENKAAAYQLARLYFTGHGKERNVASGVRWMCWLADHNDSDAQYYVGWMYEHGLLNDDHSMTNDVNLQHRVAFGLSLLMKRSADEQVSTALSLDAIQPKVPMPRLAEKWYARAAKQNHVLSCFHLGAHETFETGDVSAGQISPYLEYAGRNGGPIIRFLVASMISGSEHLNPVLKAKANLYFDLARPGLECAARDGNVDAQLALAKMYELGLAGLKRSEKLRDEWRRRAANRRIEIAERGDPMQKYEVARFGEAPADVAKAGPEQQMRWAVNWLAQSASAGFPLAQFELGRRFAKGLGVAENKQQAAYWFAKAEQYGFVPNKNE